MPNNKKKAIFLNVSEYLVDRHKMNLSCPILGEAILIDQKEIRSKSKIIILNTKLFF